MTRPQNFRLPRTKKSVFVGTGILPYLDLDAAQASACIYEFPVPRGLFSTLDERLASRDRWYEMAVAVTPGCSVTWRQEWDLQDQADALQPVVQAHLSWFNLATEEVVSMSLADARLAFEHYIDWPSSLAELSLKIGALPRSDTLTAKDLEERIVKFVIDAFPESFRDRAPPRVRRDVAD